MSVPFTTAFPVSRTVPAWDTVKARSTNELMTYTLEMILCHLKFNETKLLCDCCPPLPSLKPGTGPPSSLFLLVNKPR